MIHFYANLIISISFCVAFKIVHNKICTESLTVIFFKSKEVEELLTKMELQFADKLVEMNRVITKLNKDQQDKNKKQLEAFAKVILYFWIFILLYFNL